MATLTIELPEALAQQVEIRGIPPHHLEKMIIHLVEIYLQEYDQGLVENQTEEPTWSSGEAFARRIIANNRELFEELARL